MKHKYRIFGVVFLIVMVSFFTIISSVSAKGVHKSLKDKKLPACTQAISDDLYSKYKPMIKRLTKKNYSIYLNGPQTSGAKLKVVEVIKGSYSGDLKDLDPVKSGDSLKIPLEPDVDPATGKELVKVKLKLVAPDDICSGDVSFKISTYNDGDAFDSGTSLRNNTNIGSGEACTNFINGNYNASQFGDTERAKEDFKKYNYAAVSKEGKAFYEDALKYCFTNQVTYNFKKNQINRLIRDTIATWKVQATADASTDTEFDRKFEEVKNAAYASMSAGNGKSVYELIKKENLDKLQDTSLKCSSVVDVDKALSQNDADYYQNSSYYYASSVTDSEKVTYTYNYAPGDTRTVTKDVCDQVCEESVEVNYGPPIASKAGLCFEYKVKVTSRVRCHANVKAGSEPDVPNNICTPSPGCSNGIPAFYNQAGPNEDFEQCIKECDGGKYTTTCSNKCYKKVYGKNNTNLSLKYNDSNSLVSNMAYSSTDCLNDNSDGCYAWNGDSIYWIKGTEFGRWYYTSDYCNRLGGSCRNGDSADSFYEPDAGGFRRAGNGCSDVCWWEGCSKGRYLNPGTMASDTADNNAAYKVAIRSCKQKATCTTKTATFKISIKYDVKDNSGKKVNVLEFPYSESNPSNSNGDKIKSPGMDGQTGNNTTILEYAGCYKDEEKRRWYRTEWSFPGTWINNKHGEVSYVDKSGNKAWQSVKDKFCIPLDAENVNTNWFDCYNNYISSDKTQADKNNLNNCFNNNPVSSKKFDNRTVPSNGYNIYAEAKNFGYFGWDFGISCFYGLHRNPTKCEGEDCSECATPPCEEDKEDDTLDNHTIRPIDNDDIFPEKDASVVDTSSKVVESKKATRLSYVTKLTDKSKTGRQPGFNWSEGAVSKVNGTGKYKNEKYEVDPILLRQKIQERGDSIYSNDAEYLDYSYTLSIESLAKIKRYNEQHSYTEWSGSIKRINGINAYKSDFLDGISSYGVKDNGSHRSWGCNNYRDSAGSNCR